MILSGTKRQRSQKFRKGGEEFVLAASVYSEGNVRLLDVHIPADSETTKKETTDGKEARKEAK